MKYLFFVPAFLLTLTALHAQDAGTVEAVITYDNGRSETRLLFIPMTSVSTYPADLTLFSDQVYYLDDSGNKKQLPPSSGVSSLEFELKGVKYLLYTREWNGIMRYMQPKIDGKMQFLYYHFLEINDDGPDMRDRKDMVCIPDRDGKLATLVIHVGFKKNMIKFFSGYPEMVEKIASNEFKYKDREEMVEYFNATYGDDQE